MMNTNQTSGAHPAVAPDEPATALVEAPAAALVHVQAPAAVQAEDAVQAANLKSFCPNDDTMADGCLEALRLWGTPQQVLPTTKAWREENGQGASVKCRVGKGGAEKLGYTELKEKIEHEMPDSFLQANLIAEAGQFKRQPQTKLQETGWPEWRTEDGKATVMRGFCSRCLYCLLTD